MNDEVNRDPAGVDRDPADDRILADLRLALPTDSVPDGLVARAEALFTLRDLDRELAALEATAAELVATRGPLAAATRLSFRTGDGSLAVEVVPGRQRLDWQVISGVPTEVMPSTMYLSNSQLWRSAASFAARSAGLVKVDTVCRVRTSAFSARRRPASMSSVAGAKPSFFR